MEIIGQRVLEAKQASVATFTFFFFFDLARFERVALNSFSASLLGLLTGKYEEKL